MGIIAGIHKRQNDDTARAVLAEMLAVQSHRDLAGKAVSFVGHDMAVGGVNHFDKAYRTDAQYVPGPAGIHAFVDGIVLESPRFNASCIVASAYEKWGLDFMAHLEGEFACVVWDDNNRRLILVRDPYGRKPLHYFASTAALIFSSEIKGILAAGIPREIDLVHFSDFLTLNNIPYPGTIFKNIFQVEPGSLLIYEHGELKNRKYWTPVMAVDESITFETATVRLSSLLKRAIKKRLSGNNPYCFLSGGMDSSAIVSYVTELSAGTVHAVSVGFEEEEANELQDAETMARHVGAEFHPVIVKPDSFFSMLDTLVFHHDSPFTDTSAYPTYFAARAGAQFTDVILTGDGPDQIMGGSGHYVFAVKNDIFAARSGSRRLSLQVAARLLGKFVSDPTPSLLSKAQRKLYRDSLTPVQAAYDLRSYFPDIVKKFLCTDDLWHVHLVNNPYRHPERWFNDAEKVDDVNKYLYADMKFYLPDDLMIKVDRMCMAHGLETLSPFLDIELALLINQLPGSYKIKLRNNDIITKYLLRETCQSRFPLQISNKSKQGFGIPLDQWLKKDDGKMVKDILLDPITLNRPYFKKEAVTKLVQTFLSGRGDYFYPSSNSIAGLLTFELWHRKYMDS